jgi:hypothetical protein
MIDSKHKAKNNLVGNIALKNNEKTENINFESTSTHLKKFFNVMDSFEDKKVFVHCAVNARVSAFMHQYLTLKKGVSSEKATSPLLNQWLPTMDSNWKSIMELEIEEIE